MITGARVEINDVTRSFKETGQVIQPLRFIIDPGEFVALLGPSGCGKSTLLRLIAGLDNPDSGHVEINSFGQTFFKAFVFQDSALVPWRTVLDNVALPLELMGQKALKTLDEEKKLAIEALQKVDLLHAKGLYPNQLSGGMKMRVSVARALVHHPTLLLLDEPFAALDENTRYRLQDDLRKLWQTTRMTAVFVTHSVSEAVYLANRAIVFSGRPARVTLDRKIELPVERGADLRTDSRFADQMKIISAAFNSSGAL